MEMVPDTILTAIIGNTFLPPHYSFQLHQELPLFFAEGLPWFSGLSFLN